MRKVLDFLAGKKTYILAVIAGIDVAGSQLGFWEANHVREAAEAILGVVFLRAGVDKSGPIVK